MDQKELEAYKAFMYDPKNSHNCEECAMNEGFSAWPETRLPCGQFHCPLLGGYSLQGKKGVKLW